MSVYSRNLVQDSEVIQDTDTITQELGGAGEPVAYGNTPYTLQKIYRMIWGYSKLFGEKNRRKGYEKINGSDIALTGTITSSGVTVTGSGTAFLTELAIGDFIGGTANDYKEVASITNNTSLTLVSGFASDVLIAQSFKRLQFMAERLGNLPPIGTIIPYTGITAPAGYLFTDGSAVSRTTYSNLFSAISVSKGTFSVTIASPGVVTLTTHGLATGDCVSITTTGTLPTGLSASNNYYVIYINTNTFWLATSYTNAIAGTKINTSVSQSGVHSLLYNPYGISGASNFLLPDTRAAFLRGSGTSTLFTANKTIGLGNYVDDSFQGHWHAAAQLLEGAGSSQLATSAGAGALSSNARSAITDGVNGTPRTGSETTPKFVGVNYAIKY